jgi:hypothetical protein
MAVSPRAGRVGDPADRQDLALGQDRRELKQPPLDFSGRADVDVHRFLDDLPAVGKDRQDPANVDVPTERPRQEPRCSVGLVRGFGRKAVRAPFTRIVRGVTRTVPARFFVLTVNTPAGPTTR